MLPCDTIWFELVICMQRRLTDECDLEQCSTLLLRQLDKSTLPRNKADWGWTKVIVDHKTLSEGRERSFINCQLASIEIDPAVMRNRLTSKLSPFNWRAVQLPIHALNSVLV